jgi:acetyl esterase/lipase
MNSISILRFLYQWLVLSVLTSSSLIAAEVTVSKDVVYGKGDDTPLLMDIYDPPLIGQSRPAAIVIHGGGWLNGDKSKFAPDANWFAKQGIFTICVNYRLSAEAKAPAAVEDVKCAVRWLRANAAEHHLDTAHLLATGSSAGGHLALVLGLCHEKELEGKGGNEDQSSAVSGVIDNYGIADVNDLLEGAHKKSWAEAWIPRDLPEREAAIKLVSPIENVSKEAVPLLIVHGDSDPIVPYEHSVALNQKMKNTAGVYCKLFTVPGGGHGANFSGSLKNIQEEKIQFLKEQGFVN